MTTDQSSITIPVLPWLIPNAHLGPACRFTAPIDIVYAGAKAQMCHEDYHPGVHDFTENDKTAKFNALCKAATHITGSDSDSEEIFRPQWFKHGGEHEVAKPCMVVFLRIEKMIP